MVAELLTIWGVKTAWSAFGPVLEELAQDFAKDATKSYFGKCFGSVFSAASREPLTKGAGRMVKELLDLLEYELGLDEDTDKDELLQLQRAAAAFLKQEVVREAIAALLKEPQHLLDAAILAQAWQDVQDAPTLPEDFSWLRISKRFSRKGGEIRDSIPELKSIFAHELAAQADKALADNLGPQPDFDLETYAEALLEKFGRPGSLALASVDLDGPAYDAVRLWQVFVPQSVRECRDYRPQQLELPKGEEERQERLRPYFDQQPRPVLEVCADQQLQRIVILGDPGSGKSSLLRFLALEWARDSDPNHRALAPVPLLIELRDYNQWECSSGKSFIAYLHHARNWHQFNQNALDALLQRPGRVLLLLDGLDEIFDPQQRKLAVNDIFRFSNEYKDVRIIVTSRVVGYEAHWLRDAEFRDFMLQDFAEEQIAQFLGRWHEVIFAGNQAEGERKQERLAKAIKDSRPIKLLAGNPLLLTLMAIINRNQELPRDRVRLYEKAAELLLQQWDTERYLQDFPGLSAEIDLRAKSAILRKVALHMQTADGKAANLIEGERLVGLIEEYLRDELRFDQARAAANALVKQLRERNFILCFLGGDSYAFVHRTFLEYFCAAEYVHQFEKKRSLSLDDLLALYDAHCRDEDYWQEVLRLICGQLDEQFAGKIIEHLTGLVNMEVWDKKTEIAELELAAWCLSEVKSINNVENAIKDNFLSMIINFLSMTEADVYIFYRYDRTILYEKGKSALVIKWINALVIIFQKREWIKQLNKAKNISVRIMALEILTEYFFDKDTLSYLIDRAVSNHECAVRNSALYLLGEYWTDDNKRERLHKLVAYDRIVNKELYNNEEFQLVSMDLMRDRQYLARLFLATIWSYRFKPSNFFDPRQPIPAEHIQEAAEQALIPPDKIDEAVSLSEQMGWDIITKGSLAGKL